MLEIIRILYRELQYQMIKRNPLIASDERKFKKALKNSLNIKRGIVPKALSFMLFGVFMASGIAFSDDRLVISSMAVSLAIIPFVFALYVTAVQSPYVVSLGLFEPLKSLPVKIGAFYLSELLLLDISVSFAIALPSIVVLLVKYPLSGMLFMLWMIVGLFAGHTIGLIIFSLFGLRITLRKTRGQTIKNLIKITGLLTFMGMFYVLTYLQEYIVKHSENLTNFFGRYIIAYPFSVASIFDPFRSLIFLASYSVVFISLYILSINKVWKEILDPRVTSEKVKAGDFKTGFGGAIFALTIKDLRIIFRKTSMIAGFLIPVYFILPQIFMALKNGSFSKELTHSLIFTTALFSISGVDAILKVEGKEINFLRTLPVTKNQFILSKALSMSQIPMALLIVIFCIGTYFDSGSVFLLPYVFLLPINVSLVTMLFLFHYEGEEIGLPEVNFGKVIILFIINGILLGITGLPALLVPTYTGLLISYCLALLILLFLSRKLKSKDGKARSNIKYD